MTESELLAALIHHCGGELRIDRLTLEQIEGRQVIADIQGSEIILRLTTNRVQIFPKCQDRLQPPIISAPSPMTHSVLNEDKLKQLEAERVKQEKLRQWQEQSAQVLSQMPVPSKGQ